MNILKRAKAMEEQIIKIINKNTNRIYQQVHMQERCAEEIKSHIMEFIEWFFKEYRWELTLQTNDGPLIYGFNNQNKFVGNLNEIYQYWLNNVKHA